MKIYNFMSPSSNAYEIQKVKFFLVFVESRTVLIRDMNIRGVELLAQFVKVISAQLNSYN